MNNNYQNGKLIFGHYDTFENVFPQVREIKVTVTETGRNISSSHPSIYNFRNFREVINCSNLACISGGLKIGNIVREMIENKEIFLEVNDYKCEGHEKQINKICWNFFSYKVEISYK
ncbi:hypothetical protein C8C83_0172 [Flavobacterium sp. 90]|uniref:hypothetical protein n=1 Tax=unclassified Flavobacterium TaxID=196869 RepID=UPI000EB4A8A0|nr:MULTISPECIES: hypothetical protein [unclassified Flavobacterium]RKR08589.1 hypothetical protein C8C82_0465 [Flavobacterium sp. 81]TCK52379.1 hypothetical protein C8C83_0172 [Flavobacterium sp. 90]